MFSNPGKSVKTVAAVFCTLGIIASVVLGIMSFSTQQIGFGFGYIIGGSLLSYLLTIVIYAFGDMVENTHMCNVRLKAIDEKIKNLKKEIQNNINTQNSNDIKPNVEKNKVNLNNSSSDMEKLKEAKKRLNNKEITKEEYKKISSTLFND